MEAVTAFFSFINGYLWGPPMIILLFGTHLFMTIRTKFIQRKIGTAIKLSFTPDKESTGDVSQFGALTTALAATIGTGNIIGVGTAIALGGPGAVLWVWLTGVFGIATKYAESYISVKYRVRTADGTMLGGAMYALERGMKSKGLGKFLAVLFALFAAIAAFGIGAAVQSNAIASTLNTNYNVPQIATGIVLVILATFVIFGGVKAIARVCETLVPFMVIFYVIGCIIILIMNGPYLGQALALIFEAAFNPRAAGGGFVGSTILLAARYGIARGLFSNESGMGSAPIVAAAAKTKNPARQALVSMSGTFWDTVVVCALTGLVLVSTIVAHPDINALSGNGAELTSLAFSKIPVFGTPLLVAGITLFAFSTILGWGYYGERGAEYLMGKKALKPYRAVFILAAFLGVLGSVPVVWEVADTLNALMAIPNLIAILALSGLIARETNHYVYDGNLDEVDTTPIPLVSPDGFVHEELTYDTEGHRVDTEGHLLDRDNDQ